MENSFLHKEKQCEKCQKFLKMVKYTRNVDKYAWRCMQKTCVEYKKYFYIRKGSFFDNLNVSLLLILRIVIKYSSRTQRYALLEYFNIGKNSVLK